MDIQPYVAADYRMFNAPESVLTTQIVAYACGRPVVVAVKVAHVFQRNTWHATVDSSGSTA